MEFPVDLRKALQSFRYAGKGIADLFIYENNARIHLFAAVSAITAGFYFGLSTTEWALLITQIALVWAAEAFNTALEKLADAVSSDYHPLIKSTKDLAAAGVLIVAISAAIVGVLIFLPKILLLF
ncbi:diacylglycerol kinase family protein [Persicitalea jodogahamensis]|uniref:Diacylglycerol kinase n=1 Tax=Persicitalea jodogahamensis TaxID=402147 RepID=A0A8J3D548_9BACT|nr:diacylglycerol kinase family protein [Persicitalea jodogahamensis]GHB52946.1 diacylglycerol kinase [Persicitalea jodogahamensis]